MNELSEMDPVSGYKAQARRLRDDLASRGTTVSHSAALELVARQHGARDWNTLRARATAPTPLALGDRVSGHYLSQPFAGVVHGLERMARSTCLRVTLHFDEPVDVVRFDSFSSFRQRVSAVIGADGRSLSKTSDGVPQLVVRAIPH